MITKTELNRRHWLAGILLLQPPEILPRQAQCEYDDVIKKGRQNLIMLLRFTRQIPALPMLR